MHSIFLLFLTIPLIFAGELDNGLIGSPIISCENDHITVQFSTKRPFKGRAYVRGMEDDPKCSQRFLEKDFLNSTEYKMKIKRNDCDMDQIRIREGLARSAVIIISFHPVLETKHDVAFRAMCVDRFENDEPRLENGKNHSELAVQSVNLQCIYKFHHSKLDSPPVRYARLEQAVLHVWECNLPDSKNLNHSNDFGILVHSCVVEDGHGSKYELLDEHGCSFDHIAMPELEYENEPVNGSIIRAMASIWTSKFSRSNEMKFKCSIAICDRKLRQCDGLTPPKCDDKKEKRGRAKLDGLKQFDVIEDMFVLDHFDQQLGFGKMLHSNLTQELNLNGNKRICVATVCNN